MAVLITRDFNGNEVRRDAHKRGRKMDSVSVAICDMEPGDQIEIIGSFGSAYSRCKTAIKKMENPPIFHIEATGNMTCMVTAFDRKGRSGVSCNRDMDMDAFIRGAS